MTGETAPALPSFTAELWAGIAPIYAETIRHPFLQGLSDGSLPRSRFQFYLVQDGLYLRAFGQSLSVLASKAPREEWALTLNRHAAEAIRVERELHGNILASFGVSPETARETGPAPANYAYTSHLLATVYRLPFAHGLAALLPCYWIYWEVGKALKQASSTNPDYRRWIDLYSGEEYGAIVSEVIAMMDMEAARLDAPTRRELKRLFETSARYEWMFWDSAWHEERWPPE